MPRRLQAPAPAIALVDPPVVERNVLEGVHGLPKVLGKHLRRRVRKPIGHEQRVEFGGFAVVEGEDKLGAVGLQTQQRMGKAGGEVPEIALLHVGHLRTSVLVENRHPAVPVGHHRPFRLLVPVKLADAAGTEGAC